MRHAAGWSRRFSPGAAPGVLLALLAFSLPATAAPRGLDPHKAVTQYGLDVWSADEGLPQNTVNAILQTRDGYLWVGTYEGLARFDGVRFTVFGTGTGLSANGIRALAEDRDGTLWVGTNGGGLSRLQHGRIDRYTLHEGLSSDIVWALQPDHAGGLWIGTNGGGLMRFRDGRFESFPKASTGATVAALCEDRAGNLWVGTHGEGLKKRAPDGVWTRYTVRDGLGADVVSAITEGRDGSLWIGTVGGGISRLRDGRFTTWSTPQGLPSIVWALCEDREGSLWLATGGTGLVRFRDGAASTFSAREGLPENVLYAVHEDREGSLWLGSNGSGLCRLRDGKLTTYTTREGLAHDYVYAVQEDTQGRVWAGTSGGLSVLAAERPNPVGMPPGQGPRFAAGPITQVVRSLASDPDGTLWVGTYGAGVSRLRSGHWTTWTVRDGLAHDSVRAVVGDGHGGVWAATIDGLSHLEGDVWKSFHIEQGLPRNSLICLQRSRDGALWIGTDGGGLVRLQADRFEVFTIEQGLPSNLVLAVHEDEDGVLWVGTNGGLARRRGERFSHLGARDGLASDSISQILDDGRGNLWLGTSKGVSRVEKRLLDGFEPGQPLPVLTLARSDGMRSSQCSAPGQPTRTQDGRLWFATSRGLAVLDPGQLRFDSEPPPILLESVVADGQTLSTEGGSLVLRPGTRRLELHYTSLSLLAPDKARFKFRLEGFDPDWVDAGSERVAHYTQPPPGRYTFRVIGCNGDGVWNQSGAVLVLELQPHFYQTRIFYALMLVGVLGAAATLHQVRLRQHVVNARELTALVEERTRTLNLEKERALLASQQAETQKRLAEDASEVKTELLGIAAHDLKNPLQAVLGFSELIGTGEHPPKVVEDMAEGINKSALRMLALIDDLLTTAALEVGNLDLNKHAVDLGRLVTTLAEEGQRQAERKNQRLELAIETGVVAELDEDRIRQVVENLVSNALKYSPPGKTVFVAVRGLEGRARLEVRDEGPGLTAADQARLFSTFVRGSARPTGGESSTGLGLSIVKRLVDLHGGRVWAESTGPGHGSLFVVELPRILRRP